MMVALIALGARLEPRRIPQSPCEGLLFESPSSQCSNDQKTSLDPELHLLPYSKQLPLFHPVLEGLSGQSRVVLFSNETGNTGWS